LLIKGLTDLTVNVHRIPLGHLNVLLVFTPEFLLQESLIRALGQQMVGLFENADISRAIVKSAVTQEVVLVVAKKYKGLA